MTYDRIEMKPGVMGGKPVIKGTRISVAIIVRECAHGSPEYVADLFSLAADDVRAALAYAAAGQPMLETDISQTPPSRG